MKDIKEFLHESLECKNNNIQEAEESIKDEKTFKDYAENKFKTVFGDKLDEDRMNKVIDGILKKYKKDAENGDWGVLVGVLNKSF